jgi:hypothetical protein
MTMEDDRDPPLAHLSRDEPPPAELRQRVRRNLHSRGLLARPGRASRGLLIAAGLAGLALFATGLAVGRRTAPSMTAVTTAPGPRFALLLYEPAGFDQDTPESRLVMEYREWATTLGGNRLDLGEKLSIDERLLQPAKAGGEPPVPAATPSGPLAGFFIIRAGDWDEAMAIARTCPHLSHGGVVAVRRIEET